MGVSSTNEVSASDLPAVATVSSKQTTFDDSNSSFVAYKQAFDPLWHIKIRGVPVHYHVYNLTTEIRCR